VTAGSVLVAASSLYMVLVALLLGSFINLAADRLPKGESVVRPPSFCRSCGRRLNVLDLVPVAGYVVRRGRCATCGVPIGVSAPIVEASAATAVAVPLVALGPFAGGVLGASLVVLLGATIIAVAMARARGGVRS
jgi:prepilin signal peptidase PulO-like enzyme (type II secretory pathway)